MKNITKSILSLILCTISFQCFAQDNWNAKPKIIITQTPQTVPSGKRWILLSGEKTIIQISDGTLNSGTFCNAMLLSNPRIIYNLNKGDYHDPKTFGIIFKDLVKVPYTNDYTFNITPISIIDKNFSLSDLQYKSPENAGRKEIDFNEGESVYVNNCLESIELTEISVDKTYKKTFPNQNALYTPPGNQGKPNGSTLVNNYNGLGSGNKAGFNLMGRSFTTKPLVNDEHHNNGKIVIDMQIDRTGNILSAYISRGTTIVDSSLIAKCINAVKNAKVTPLDSAPQTQKGQVVFMFKSY